MLNKFFEIRFAIFTHSIFDKFFSLEEEEEEENGNIRQPFRRHLFEIFSIFLDGHTQ